ncbi:MAG: hypothetical protein IKD80_02200, partial [Selenomonadaceae bacterium]|nr:hypothetical protein [Selenomonadaceae bacterium]
PSIRPLPTRSIRRRKFSARSVRADAVNPTVADALNSATEIFSPQCSSRRRQSDRCRRAQFGDRNFQPAQMSATKKFLGTDLSAEELFRRIYV